MTGKIMGKEPGESNSGKRPLEPYEAVEEPSTEWNTNMEEWRMTDQLSRRESKKIGSWVSEVLSGQENPSEVFREVSSTIGYALGRGMSDKAEPDDINGMAWKLYGRFQLEEQGSREMLSRYWSRDGSISDPEFGVYGVPAVEAVRHLRDSILRGYWDGQPPEQPHYL